MRREAQVFPEILATLRNLPGLETRVDVEPHQASLRPDARIEIGSDRGTSHYIAEAKPSVTTTTLPAVLAQLRRTSAAFNLPPLLVAPYLTPAVTERLLEERIEFVDGAGNVFIDGPAGYVLILGRGSTSKRDTGGFTEKDLHLIFAFLARPSLRTAPYREIQRCTGVSLGQISKTVASLEAAHHVFRSSDRTLVFRDPRRLLERWEIGYLETLRPKLLLWTGRLGPNATVQDIGDQLRSGGVHMVGGEYAAAELTRYLRPETLTIHMLDENVQQVVADLRIPRTDQNANAFLLRRFAPPLDVAPESGHGALAHPILVRAELLALDNDRLQKVADRILDDIIVQELEGNRA